MATATTGVISLADLVAQYTPGDEWSWDEEAADIASHPCPSVRNGVDCPHGDPEPGCYQRALERYLSEVGAVTQPVCLGNDGRIWDGHHRIVAALALGFDSVPVETY